MGKRITNHFELKDACRSASLGYIGSFMLEVIKRRDEWENPNTKQSFIESMFDEYSGWDKDVFGTRTRVNVMIRIIESRKVEDALRLVIDADDRKLDCPQAKINAKIILNMIEKGDLKY